MEFHQIFVKILISKRITNNKIRNGIQIFWTLLYISPGGSIIALWATFFWLLFCVPVDFSILLLYAPGLLFNYDYLLTVWKRKKEGKQWQLLTISKLYGTTFISFLRRERVPIDRKKSLKQLEMLKECVYYEFTVCFPLPDCLCNKTQ